MKNLLLQAIIIILGTLSFACESSKILTADFESDAINVPPTKNLPGNPDGDVIKYHDAIQPRLQVKNSSLSGSKSLHYIDNPISDAPPVASQWVGFKGIGTDLTQTLWFIYTGKSHGAGVTIDISDGHINTMGRLVIAPSGEASVVHSFGPDVPDHPIGNVGTGAHTVVFTVFTSLLKYNITIIKENGANIVAENQPMITTNLLQFSNPAHPTISFLLTQPTRSTTFYEIGSVGISRKEP
jgi:hypothetical protein